MFVSLLLSKKAASAREKGVADAVIKCFLQGDWHLIALRKQPFYGFRCPMLFC